MNVGDDAIAAADRLSARIHSWEGVVGAKEVEVTVRIGRNLIR